MPGIKENKQIKIQDQVSNERKEKNTNKSIYRDDISILRYGIYDRNGNQEIRGTCHFVILQ